MVYPTDLELKLLSNKPILAGGVPVCHVPFDKISVIGFRKYLSIANMLSMKSDDIADLFEQKNVKTTMCLIWAMSETVEDFWALFWPDFCLVCTALFGREPIRPSGPEKLSFGEFEINEDNWQEVAMVIRARNCLGTSGAEDDSKPADEAARQLIKRRDEMRKKLAARSNQAEDSVTMVDLVSIFASVVKLPTGYVSEQYDIYQLSNQFKRTQMYENYHLQLEALLHGAKSEDIDFQHYVRNITDDK